MTETETEELGKRAVACKHWEWMAGMKMHGRGNVYRLTYIPGEWDYDNEDAEAPEDVKVLHGSSGDDAPAWGWPAPNSGWLPDLADPATLGCLLHLVRKVHDRPEIYTHPVTDEENPTRWEVGHPLRWGRRQLTEAPTEAEALVAALEAAP